MTSEKPEDLSRCFLPLSDLPSTLRRGLWRVWSKGSTIVARRTTVVTPSPQLLLTRLPAKQFPGRDQKSNNIDSYS